MVITFLLAFRTGDKLALEPGQARSAPFHGVMRDSRYSTAGSVAPWQGHVYGATWRQVVRCVDNRPVQFADPRPSVVCGRRQLPRFCRDKMQAERCAVASHVGDLAH